jgi:hypothetical protein
MVTDIFYDDRFGVKKGDIRPEKTCFWEVDRG